MTSAPASVARREVLARRIRLLVGLTIGYNVIEAAIALTAGAAASSSALIGFGLDSVIEVSSAAAVAWQFSAADEAVRQTRERTTMGIIAASFFVLAAYVSLDAVRTMLGSGEARPSPVGIALAAVSVVVMPVLSAIQRRTGRELGSASAVADSKQTLLCTYLSAVLLVGLVLNATLGWSWADPLAALAIAAIAVREGLDAARGRGCCAPAGSLFATVGDDGGRGAEGDSACDCSPGCACCAPGGGARSVPDGASGHQTEGDAPPLSIRTVGRG